MGPSKPVRLKLSRRKGFRLQKLSLATNGLPAVNCARPSKFGNPFRVGELDVDGITPLTPARAVERFALFLAGARQEAYDLRIIIRYELRGKNVACFCGPSGPCHADELLRIANRRK